MRDEIEELAMTQVIKHETLLGRRPIDIHLEKRGYDIESFSPEENCLKFIEVKGRAKGAETLTISKNEILTGLNASDNFILAIVCVDENRQCDTRYVRNPFLKEPDFDVTSVNYNLKKLLERSEEPS
jgi:hypothetical protein